VYGHNLQYCNHIADVIFMIIFVTANILKSKPAKSSCGCINRSFVKSRTELMHALDWMMQTSIPEPFQPSPSFLAVVEKGFESEYEGHSMNIKQQSKLQGLSVSSPHRSVSTEKDRNGSSNSGIARIKVVVRKRPINKKELARKEEDIITIKDIDCSLTVHEPKVKVDLTAYVEKHEFVFDAVLDQYVSNDEVYRTTVEPIVPTIFQRTKATCFAYGQTGKHDRTSLLNLIMPCSLWF
jgi:kinesin family protein 2/24